MVKSILVEGVVYAENPAIETDDLNYEANLYQFNKTTIFALGQPKYTYIDQGLIYYPIYDEQIGAKIGVYEILSSAQPHILDDVGEVDLNKLASPPLLFKKKTKPHWLQEFLQNTQYNIIDQFRDGHSLFAALKSGLAEKINIPSIDKMRDWVAKNATEEQFQKYKALYEEHKASEESLTLEIKNLAERYNALKPRVKNTKDRNLQMSLLTQSREIKTRHDELKKERLGIIALAKEYEFMKEIKDLSQLKIVMLTPKYLADEWAIALLERALNIKTVIFSETNYIEGDELNVLQCGQQVSGQQVNKTTKFEPSFYVLLCQKGPGYYQLITYDRKSVFTFVELPSEIKNLVKEKCLERNSGAYNLIPDFK